MPLYKYRAVDEKGEPFEGVMEEDSARQVTTVLQERGLQVNAVEPLSEQRVFARDRRLSWADVDLLNQQLLAITRTGVPLPPALASVAKDVHRPRLRAVLERLRKDLEQGASLDEALQRQGDAFPPVYVSLIRAGERAGNLSGVLSILASHSTRMLDLRNTVQTSLAYPLMVIVAAILVFGFVATKVVPVFAEIFEEFGSGLPAPTQFWVDLSRVLNNHLFALSLAAVILLVLIAGGYRYAVRREHGRYARDWLVERLPLTGRAAKVSAAARFSRALALLLTNRVPVLESIDLAAAASGSAVLKRKVQPAAGHVAQGGTISDALAHTGYFPHAFCWLLATGEARGAVEDTLFSLSDTFEQEVGMQDRLLAQVLTPLAIFIVGFLIAFLVISLYLPIFTLGDAISG